MGNATARHSHSPNYVKYVFGRLKGGCVGELRQESEVRRAQRVLGVAGLHHLDWVRNVPQEY